MPLLVSQDVTKAREYRQLHEQVEVSGLDYG